MAKRVDANQPAIVQALRQVGATVQHLHELGHGCPDIVCGFRGENYLIEIKCPHAALTPDEAHWHESWRGNVAVVHSPEEALRLIGVAE